VCGRIGRSGRGWGAGGWGGGYEKWGRLLGRRAAEGVESYPPFYFILLMLREENSNKRESESMALLEKLIRLDSKDCNFHFKDDLLA
jgi:hypothetical protein